MSDNQVEAQSDDAEEVVYVISIGGSIRSAEGIHAKCTCTWRDSDSKDVMEVAADAVKHRNETGHVLRPHRQGNRL